MSIEPVLQNLKGVRSPFERRYESIRLRIGTLSSLRKLVALQPEYDITERQWSIIEAQLSSVQNALLLRLKKIARKYLPNLSDLEALRELNSLLGEIELEMGKIFAFFDTCMDVLTQRHTPALGPALAGCDILALDALRKDHPALAIIEPPLVYCDRGFGASVLREGVIFQDRSPNPMPLIQIPYSRLKEKHNLTSILHEAGHEAMVRLGLLSAIPKAFNYALSKAGAPDVIKDLFTLWTSEIGADLWAFCASGIAETGTIKEILAMPSGYVFRVSWVDPHPPPFLRVLLSFELCRQVWGRGEWDNWEKEWLELYPMESVPPETMRILELSKFYLPVICKALLKTKFRILNNKTIPDLFNLDALAPVKLQSIVAPSSGILDLKGLSPCEQLAVFRLVREQGKLSEERIDEIMTRWLLRLRKNKK